MAQSLDNVVMYGMKGTLAGMLVVRNRAGKTIVCRRPRRKEGVIATVKQEAIRDRFGLAVLYAKTAMEDVAVKDAYAAVAQPGQSAFNVAFADFFNIPKVVSIGKGNYKGSAGDVITLVAKDDFKVVSVKISIRTAAGALVEEGQAVQSNGPEWLYVATVANPDAIGSVIKATAFDVPGSEGFLEASV